MSGRHRVGPDRGPGASGSWSMCVHASVPVQVRIMGILMVHGRVRVGHGAQAVCTPIWYCARVGPDGIPVHESALVGTQWVQNGTPIGQYR